VIPDNAHQGGISISIIIETMELVEVAAVSTSKHHFVYCCLLTSGQISWANPQNFGQWP